MRQAVKESEKGSELKVTLFSLDVVLIIKGVTQITNIVIRDG